jgi:hypothetical protein
VNEGFCLLAESGESMGLMVNEEKMKYMFVGQTKVTLPDQITMNDYTFERVESFTYLGSVVTANNNASKEINSCLVAANKTYCGLQRHLKSKILSCKTKKTYVKPLSDQYSYVVWKCAGYLKQMRTGL